MFLKGSCLIKAAKLPSGSFPVSAIFCAPNLLYGLTGFGLEVAIYMAEGFTDIFNLLIKLQTYW